jgi:hypothetical protein
VPYINQAGGGGGSGAISGVTVTGTGAAGKVPVASSAAAGTWSFPPGFEINYTQITAPVNIVSTTEATGTTILSPGALTFDGTAVICEFFGNLSLPTAAASNLLVVSLFEGATQITELGTWRTEVTSPVPLAVAYCAFRFTPTAASHTYTITAFVSSTTGTPAVSGGPGGTGANPPAFVRFTKV